MNICLKCKILKIWIEPICVCGWDEMSGRYIKKSNIHLVKILEIVNQIASFLDKRVMKI